MGPVSRSASRLRVIFALCMACVGGCGTSYEMLEPRPAEHAAPDTFTIRSLTVNGHEISEGNAGEVATDEPVVVKGEINFRQGRPHPPMVFVNFVDGSGDRPVTHGSGAGRLGVRTARGTSFSVTTEAPSRSGRYTLYLSAMLSKSARNGSRAGGDRRPQVYVEAELTVVGGE